MIVFAPLLLIFIFNFQFCYGNEWTNDENCGISFTQRIIGGALASSGKYPWIARLGYKTKTKGRYTFLCGGTLIKKNFVITAAHCMKMGDKPLTVVRLGETTIECATNNCQDPKAQQFFVKKTWSQPNFSRETGFADIGLVELGHPVQYTQWVRPICLINRKLLKVGETGITAGFGIENYITRAKPDGLKELSVKILPGSDCKKYFPKANFNSENYICAGGKKKEDTCNGDSGGPLMKIDNFGKGPRMYLAGVISFGSAKCGTGAPGIYTSIQFFLDWIINLTG